MSLIKGISSIADIYQKTAKLSSSSTTSPSSNFTKVLSQAMNDTVKDLQTNESMSRDYILGKGGDMTELSVNTAKLAVQVEGMNAFVQKLVNIHNDLVKLQL